MRRRPIRAGGRKVTFARLRHLMTESVGLGLGCVTLALLTGCTVLSYTSPSGEHFTRSSLGSKTSIAHLSVESRTNGVHKVDLRGYKDDNTEALGAITEAAIRAAVTAAKP